MAVKFEEFLLVCLPFSLICFVCFSISDFDSDNMEMELGNALFKHLLFVIWDTMFTFSWPGFSFWRKKKWSIYFYSFLRGWAWSSLCALIFLFPSVWRNGHLWPGAGQQHLQETLFGEVQHVRWCRNAHRNKSEKWCWLTNTFCFVSLRARAGRSARLFPPSPDSAGPWSRCRSCHCKATTCWRTSGWSVATTAGSSSRMSSLGPTQRRRGYERATTSCLYVIYLLNVLIVKRFMVAVRRPQLKQLDVQKEKLFRELGTWMDI